MSQVFGVYGAGGCGRGILPLVRSHCLRSGAQLVFIDDAARGQRINGQDVLSFDEFLSVPASRRSIALAIAESRARQELDRKCARAGVELLEVRASNVVEMDDVDIGPGALLSPFVTLTSNVRIGRCFHANLYSYVEHDCRIGDFVTFAPGVHCNGNVHIHDHAYLGAGAIIRQGTADQPLVIGEGAVVGMGAVVTKNVSPGAIVVGNPAKPLVKN